MPPGPKLPPDVRGTMKPLADRIHEERRDRRIAATKLADEAGVHRNLIAQIECQRANPTVATLFKIATALG